MRAANRYCAGLLGILVVAATIAVGVQSISGAAETQTATPDFSGVWLPESKASGRWPTERPFTPAMTALRAEWEKRTSPIDLTRDDDHISCLPYTLPYMMTTITQYPFEIVATPERLYFFTETFGQVRRIEISDAPVSPDTLPSRTGVSRGRWEGSQLVVETSHILPEHEGTRNPGSSALRFQERFSLEDAGAAGKRLINEITILDPLVYEKPIQIRMVHKSAPGVAVGEYVCNEDLWDQQRDGSTSVIPWR